MSVPMEQERAMSSLMGCPFIEKLIEKDETLLDRLLGVAKFTHVEKDEVIFRQGDPGQNCYIILDGRVEVYLHKHRESKGNPTPRKRYNLDSYTTLAEDRKLQAERDPDGTGLTQSDTVTHYRWVTHEGFSTFSENSTLGECIVTLGQGALFGEYALMNNAPRACSIKALDECNCLTIGKEDFDSVHHDLLQASEAQVVQDFCKVLVEKCGSVMLAWRKVFDPRAAGELFFSEFVEALTSLSWSGNTSALWGALVRRAHANNREVVVGLQEISPEDHRIIDRFKFWIEDKFNGAVEMFNALTGNLPNAWLSYEDLTRACRSYGHEDQVDLMWELLDLNHSGVISLKDMAFLEIDGMKRKCALEPEFAMALEGAKSAAMSLRHRSKLQKRSQERALTEFLRKLRAASGGSLIRGYRRILAINGNFTISKVEMLKGCRQVAFEGDVMALWKAMDQDGDGCVQLGELDVRMALVLASFKKWSNDNHGSCVKAMQHLAVLAKRRTAKWSVEDLVAAVSQSSWQGPGTGISVRQATAMVHEAADIGGRRSIVAKDVAFLDSWEPTTWLCAEADYAGKEQLINMLRNRYANLIVAWRRVFDRSNKNHVTYKDFSHACMSFQVKNAPGIWRALDTDLLGYISLKDIDNKSAQVLLNFKNWAEETFGTIQFAFRVFDSTHNNSVSLPVFKRVLSDFGYQGDARILFQSLKPDTSGRHANRDARLRLEDMKHLSSWETIHDYDSDEEDEKPKSASEEAKLNKEGASGSKTLPAPRTATSMNPSSSGRLRPYSTTSEFFTFCRSSYEYDIFNEVRVRRSKYATKRYNIMDVLNVEDTAESEDLGSQFEKRSHPYERPLFSNTGSRWLGAIPSVGGHYRKPGSIGSSRPQSGLRTSQREPSKSASLPALVEAGRPAGSLGLSSKEGKHLPSLVKTGAQDRPLDLDETEEGEVTAEGGRGA